MARNLPVITAMNLVFSIANLPESSGMLYFGLGLVALAIVLRRIMRTVQASASANRRVQDAPHTERI